MILFAQLLGQLKTFAGVFFPALGAALALYGGFWVKGVFDQKKRNAINELDLSFKKIDLDNQSKPVGDIVADSNKSHGVDTNVVKKP